MDGWIKFFGQIRDFGLLVFKGWILNGHWFRILDDFGLFRDSGSLFFRLWIFALLFGTGFNWIGSSKDLGLGFSGSWFGFFGGSGFVSLLIQRCKRIRGIGNFLD